MDEDCDETAADVQREARADARAEVRDELAHWAHILEQTAERATQYAAMQEAWRPMASFDEIRKAAKALRRPGPTPLPKTVCIDAG